jgi:colicin import membrane protein
MKAIQHAHAHRYQSGENESRLVTLSFGISIFVHLLFIGALVFLPEPTPRSRFSSGVVNVSLVSLPGKAPAAGARDQIAAPPKKEAKKPPKAKLAKIAPPPKKPVVVPQKPKNAVSLAPKPKQKASLKKKTINRTKMIEGAVKDVRKKVEDSDSASVKKALDRLKKQVEETEAANPRPYQTDTGKSGSGGTGPAEGGPKTLEVIKIYQAEIQYQIQKNWAFSQQLAGNSTELEAVLAIKILRDGEIQDIWFDKHSGNEYLDESAYKALVKSNPLPPLPIEYTGAFYKIGLIFGPKGLK